MANIDNSLYRQMLDFYGIDTASKLIRAEASSDLIDEQNLLAVNAIINDLHATNHGDIGVRKRRMEIETTLFRRLEEDRKAATKK